MAIYHLRLGMVQRSRGQSVVAVAADRARVRLHDSRLDRTFATLPAKCSTQPILSEVLLPTGRLHTGSTGKCSGTPSRPSSAGPMPASPGRLKLHCQRNCRASKQGIWSAATC
jgi:hypothetical protein